jgi:hypothetical protein
MFLLGTFIPSDLQPFMGLLVLSPYVFIFYLVSAFSIVALFPSSLLATPCLQIIAPSHAHSSGDNNPHTLALVTHMHVLSSGTHLGFILLICAPLNSHTDLGLHSALQVGRGG